MLYSHVRGGGEGEWVSKKSRQYNTSLPRSLRMNGEGEGESEPITRRMASFCIHTAIKRLNYPLLIANLQKRKQTNEQRRKRIATLPLHISSVSSVHYMKMSWWRPTRGILLFSLFLSYPSLRLFSKLSTEQSSGSTTPFFNVYIYIWFVSVPVIRLQRRTSYADKQHVQQQQSYPQRQKRKIK